MESLPGKSPNKSDKKWFQVSMPCKKCRKRFLYKFRIVSENCDEVYYCSRECCHDDNISLKKNCSSFHNTSKISPAKNCQVSSEFSKGEEIQYFQEKGTDRPEGTIVTCLHCGKTCDDSVVCADCRYVHYCTPGCLLKDEALHQEKCAFAVLFNYIDDTLLHGQTYTHLKYKGLTEETNASPFLFNLVHEFAPFIAGPFVSLNRPVIIVQIVGPYPHSWRDAVFVQDIEHVVTHIIFHDDPRKEAYMTGGPNVDRDVVKTAPLTSCLKPGNFIVLLDAWWHLFKDMKMGVRIDSLEKVHFFWMD